MSSSVFPIDAFVGLPTETLETLQAKLVAQLAAGGGRMIVSENDGGLSLAYSVIGTPADQLRAVRYALNGFTAEDLAAREAAGRGRAGFRVPTGAAALHF